MSKSSFFLKPPVLIAGMVVLILIAMSSFLKKKVEITDASEKVERTDFDRLDTGRTRIASVNAPAVSSKRQSTADRAPTATRQEPRKQIVEDFNTALRRAEGTGYLTGRIIGDDPAREPAGQEERRREWGQRRDGDSGNSDNQQQDGNSNRGDRGGWFERFGRNVPVANAEVQLYEDDPNTTHPPLRTAVTDEQGSFTIASLNDAEQRYIMVVKADNYAPEATYVSLNRQPGQVLMRLETGTELRGKVLDKETSEPVSGAVVYQPNSRWEAFAPLGTTTSTITGDFVFPNVQEGNNLTQAQADGYATTKARIRAPDDNLTIEMQSGGASISGVTIDRLTGKPEGGARVWAENGFYTKESVVSSEDGTFTISNLPEGSYEVYAVRGMKSESQTIELERRQAVTDVELIMPAELLVSGQVLHATERKPLEGVKVWYESTKGAQFRKTNAEGRFAFETMAVDEYSILIREKGFLPVSDKRSTGSDEIIVRKVAKNQSSDELVIRLRPVPTLAGKVVGERGRGGSPFGTGGFTGFTGFSFGGGFAGGFGGRGGGGGGGGGNRGGAANLQTAAAAGESSSAGANNQRAEEEENEPGVSGADVTLSYLDGREFVQLTTKSDAAGNFFFNLPKGRGEGLVVAKTEILMAAREVRVPRNRPIQLRLGRDFMVGSLLLTDESSLDGVRVDVARWIPRNRADSDRAKRVTLTNVSSMRGGRIFAPLPRDENIELSFYMPDGVTISKDFKTNDLINSRPIFVYDPVSEDIIADTTPRQRDRGDGGGRRGEGGRGGNGNRNLEGGGRRGDGSGQPAAAEGNSGGGGTTPGAAQPITAPVQ